MLILPAGAYYSVFSIQYFHQYTIFSLFVNKLQITIPIAILPNIN
jgi:hypothetical protein